MEAAGIKDAPVILLDESTASIDPENETMIQEAIGKLIENKTVLIIAHKLRSIACCDKIVVLKEVNQYFKCQMEQKKLSGYRTGKKSVVQ